MLDQFTRHVYRRNKEAFSFDDLALSLCVSGIEVELDRDLSIIERAFFYMPMQKTCRFKTLGCKPFKSCWIPVRQIFGRIFPAFSCPPDRIAISSRNSAGFPIAIRPWDENARSMNLNICWLVLFPSGARVDGKSLNLRVSP